MKPRILHWILGFTLCLSSCWSLNAGVDSTLENQYWGLYEKMEDAQYSNPDSSYYFATQLLELSTENRDSLWIAAALEGQGYAYFYKNEMDKALEKFLQQKDIFIDVADAVDLSLAYMNIANAQGGQSLYEQSIQNYLRAQRLLPPDKKYDIDRAYLNYNLASTFLDFEDFEHAGHYLQLAEKHAKSEELTDLFPPISNIQAELLLQQKEYKRARKLADSALQLSRKHNDLIEEIYALELLSRSELGLGDPSTAILLQKESLRLSRLYGDPHIELIALARLSKIYLKEGRSDEALKLATEAYNMKDGQKSLVALKEASLVYSQALETTGRNGEALSALKEYTTYQDSLNRINPNESILESQNEIFARTNRLLEDKSELQREVITRNQMILIILIIALAICGAAIAISLINIRRKNKINDEIIRKQEQLDKNSGELAQAKERLEALNRSKDKLLSILTHDVKQPFNQTLGALDVLKIYITENEELQTVVNDVRRSVENDKQTVENLLVWSKSQFAKVTSRPTDIDWYKIAEKIKCELDPSLQEKQIKIDFKINRRDKIFADPNHMEIILRNLITNAVKFSHTGGILELSSQRINGDIEISVSDQGVGMSQQQLTSLFDIEKHFSEKGTMDEAGTGLGMLIVFDFVKENKGEIHVESEPSKGSVFRLKFPAAAN